MTSFERIDETMAHPLYTPNEKGTLEQDPRGECVSIPLQSTHSECSPNGMNRKACRRASPGKDHSSKNRNAKRRSSIAVSTKNERRCTQCTDSNTHCIFKCNRCRQRKIKCSGENDEGLACTNCQSAGYTNCHFVRVSLSFLCHHGQDTRRHVLTCFLQVNSKVLQTKAPGFLFSALGATKTESMYAQDHMEPHKSAALSNVRIVPPPGYANYDIGATDPDPSFSRQPYSVNYESQQQQQSIQAYNGQPPTLPSSTPQGSLEDCYGSWNNFNDDNNKNSAENVFPEQAANQSLTQAYPYLLLGQGATRSDIPSLVAGSLGSDGSPCTVDRTLPTPTSQAQLHTNFSSLTSSPEAMSNLSFSPGYQTDNPWGASKCAPPPTTTTHRSLMHSLTSQPFNMSLREQTRPDSDMVLGFVPMTPPLPFTTLDAIHSTPTTTAAATAAAGDDFRIPHEPPFARTSQDSNGRLLSISTASAASSDCSHADSYNYGTSSNGSVRESGPKQASDAGCGLNHGSMSVDVQDQSTAAASALWSSSGALASVELQRTLQGY